MHALLVMLLRHAHRLLDELRHRLLVPLFRRRREFLFCRFLAIFATSKLRRASIQRKLDPAERAEVPYLATFHGRGLPIEYVHRLNAAL